MNLLIAVACLVLDTPPAPDRPRIPEFTVREVVAATETIGSAMVSRDGTKVAFTRMVGGTSEIFLANTDGSELRGITAFGDGLSLKLESITADGSAVAFTRRVGGSEQVFVATSGAAIRQLTSDPVSSTQPRLNGAGDRIYFRRPGGVFVMSGLGAALRRISSLPVTLGNTGIAGDRVGARFTGRLNDRDLDVLVSFEWSGSSRFLQLSAGAGPPLLSGDEQRFVTLDNSLGFDAVMAEWVAGSYVGAIIPLYDFVNRIAAVNTTGTGVVLEASGRLEEGIEYSPYDPQVLHDPGFAVAGVSASSDTGVIAYSQDANGRLAGLWVIDRRPSPIRVEAPTRVFLGSEATLRFVSTEDAGRQYVAAASFGTSPGSRLSDGRVVPLNSDRLALFSTSRDNGVFLGFRGRLDEAGTAYGLFRPPAIPRFAGHTVYFAFVVWDPSAPNPVVRISAPIDTGVASYGGPPR